MYMYIYIYINIYIHTYIYTVADRVHWLHSHNLDSRNLVRRLHATYRPVRRERESEKRDLLSGKKRPTIRQKRPVRKEGELEGRVLKKAGRKEKEKERKERREGC